MPRTSLEEAPSPTLKAGRGCGESCAPPDPACCALPGKPERARALLPRPARAAVPFLDGAVSASVTLAWAALSAGCARSPGTRNSCPSAPARPSLNSRRSNPACQRPPARPPAPWARKCLERTSLPVTSEFSDPLCGQEGFAQGAPFAACSGFPARWRMSHAALVHLWCCFWESHLAGRGPLTNATTMMQTLVRPTLRAKE